MGSLAILADDLTGALDSAAPFAAHDDPVRVSWRADVLRDASRSALDTESRNVAARAATARVRASLGRLCDADMGFKKVDSLFRGNTLAELATCASSSSFRSLVIAPAFPEQGRITRGGTQIAAGPNGAAVRIDLVDGLARHDVPVQVFGRGRPLPEEGVLLCDAETGADLADIAVTARGLRRPLLWCGSAGLARALGGPLPMRIEDGAEPRLLVVGSTHPVSRLQAARTAECLGRSAATVRDGDGAAAAVAMIARTLGAGRSAALHFALPPSAPSDVEAVMSAAFRHLARVPPPAVLIVVGGDTLFRVCRAIHAECLLASGEWAPGVPMARIEGGDWHGVQLISKSGAFGDAETLVGLLGLRTETTCR